MGEVSVTENEGETGVGGGECGRTFDGLNLLLIASSCSCGGSMSFDTYAANGPLLLYT